MTGGRRWVAAGAVLAVVTVGLGGTAFAAPRPRGSGRTEATASSSASFPIAANPVPVGAQRLHFEVGPLTVKPGQNSISNSRRIPQPPVGA